MKTDKETEKLSVTDLLRYFDRLIDAKAAYLVNLAKEVTSVESYVQAQKDLFRLARRKQEIVALAKEAAASKAQEVVADRQVSANGP